MILRNVSRIYEHNLYFRRNVVTSIAVWKHKSMEKEETKLKNYVMTKYLKYVTNYEQMLEKRFPSAMQVYRVFTYGIKNFYQDLKAFFKIRLLILNSSLEEGLGTLKRQEIELYDQMPKDMWKISPVLILSALPFANYIVFPIAYMYPRKWLTSHFWTEEQKKTFDCLNLKDRIYYSKSLLHNLTSCTKAINDEHLKLKWKEILITLGKGGHPTPEKILECKTIFSLGPYSISNLHYKHKKNLLYFHGLSSNFSRNSALFQRALILKEMDKAILREGGVKAMSNKEMHLACSIRGLEASKMKEIEIIEWLEKWIMVSNGVESEEFSLLLHTPMLISINVPNNSLVQC